MIVSGARIRRVLEELRATGSSTVGELAARLGLSPELVRCTLRLLLSDGEVARRGERWEASPV